jgi:hypothetical protein
MHIYSAAKLFGDFGLPTIKIALHWWGDSKFSAQFTVKNVNCFSDIFH